MRITRKKLRNSIAFKSVAFVVFQLILFAAIVSSFGFQVFSDAIYRQYTDEAFRIADAAALAIDADRLNEYKAEKGNDPDYQKS